MVFTRATRGDGGDGGGDDGDGGGSDGVVVVAITYKHVYGDISTYAYIYP